MFDECVAQMINGIDCVNIRARQHLKKINIIEMRKPLLILTLILTMISKPSFAQEVSLNENLKIYEYTHVKEFDSPIENRLDLFTNKMKELNYSGTEKTNDGIKGENFFTKMIFGSAMEVHFNTLIMFKEGQYKVTINNFRIKDERYGTVAVETLRKSSQKKWVKFINEQLPQVVANIENTDTW